jgi:hypothetical protein
MTLDRNAACMGEIKHEYAFLMGTYEGKIKIKPRKMKLEKNEPSVGQMK